MLFLYKKRLIKRPNKKLIWLLFVFRTPRLKGDARYFDVINRFSSGAIWKNKYASTCSIKSEQVLKENSPSILLFFCKTWFNFNLKLHYHSLILATDEDLLIRSQLLATPLNRNVQNNNQFSLIYGLFN